MSPQPNNRDQGGMSRHQPTKNASSQRHKRQAYIICGKKTNKYKNIKEKKSELKSKSAQCAD